jgi:hypothetical protein
MAAEQQQSLISRLVSSELGPKPATIFIRHNKRSHHFGIDKVAIQVELAEPVIITRLVRVPSQIREVFHKDKHRIELLIVIGLSVSRIETQEAAGDSRRAINDLVEDAGATAGRRGFGN